MAQLDGRQVKCCTYDRGDVWIHALDNLPLLVRRRLADARYNICPTCMAIDTRNNGAPTLKLYFAVIEAIERVLEQAERRFNEARTWKAFAQITALGVLLEMIRRAEELYLQDISYAVERLQDFQNDIRVAWDTDDKESQA